MTKKRKTLIIRILLFGGTAVSLFFVPWLLVKAWILPLPDTVQAQLDQTVDHGIEGVVVYVDKAGQPPAFYASGWHNRETKIPARPNALYKIASISKLYTALAITKLVDNGTLSLDKSLAHYFPELANRIENAETITLRHMVQHRSGIPNYSDTPNYWEAPPDSIEGTIDLILDQPANFKPGEDYEYCNTNYLLLKEIMTRELGYSYFQFIQTDILDPLELNHTYESIHGVNMDEVMSGYHKGYPYDLKENDYGMMATAEDVGTLIRALNDGSAFNGGEQEIYNSIYELKHGGWVPGYQSLAEYHEDIDAVVVQFTSTTDPDLYNWNLAEIVYSRVVKIIAKQE